MKRLIALAAVLTLAGCATMPTQHMAMMTHPVHHKHATAPAKAPVPMPAPAPAAPVVVSTPAPAPISAPAAKPAQRRWLDIVKSHWHKKGR